MLIISKADREEVLIKQEQENKGAELPIPKRSSQSKLESAADCIAPVMFFFPHFPTCSVP